jgi:hypothetical protein
MSKQGVTITREFRKPRRRKVEITEREVDGVLMPGKECTKCGEWKPLETGFYRDKKGLGGRVSECKDCRKKYNLENQSRRLDYLKKWYQENQEQRLRYSRNRYQEKKEDIKKWYEENRAHLSEYRRKYYQENQDYFSEYKRKHYQENRESYLIRNQKRRTRKHLLPENWTIEQKTETWSYFNNACVLTGVTDNIEEEHAIPLSIGHGGTYHGNMYPMSKTLNISKLNRNIFEWFYANRERFNLDEQRFNDLIQYLATLNGLTPEEYRQFVYWCHENPRTEDQIAADPRHSIEIWREASGLHFPLPSYAIESVDMTAEQEKAPVA